MNGIGPRGDALGKIDNASELKPMSGEMDRRKVISGAVATLAAAGAALPSGAWATGPAKGHDLRELTWMPAWRIAQVIANRQVSPVEVADHFIARADALDPLLNCYRVFDRSGAKEQALLAEQAVMRRDRLGALHGVPMAVKAHVAVKGLPYQSDSVAPKGGDGRYLLPNAAADSPVVARLRRAGATIMGTTIMSGMGSVGLMDKQFRPTEDLSLHPRNPWDLSRVPGSSSAGSCAAVAAGLLPAAIGSDGGGSIRLPSAWSGLVGVHSTLGRVPMGSPPGSSWNISVGPITRDIRDTALISSVIAGPDSAEIISIHTPAPDYLAKLERGVAGMRFAWTPDFGFASKFAGPESDRVIAAIRSAAFNFARLGAQVEQTAATFEDWTPMLGLLNPVATPPLYKGPSELRRRWWDGLEGILSNHDVLLSPTIQHVAFTQERWDQSWRQSIPNFSRLWCAHTFPHNFLGWPGLSIPCGFVDGLPIGLQITARPDSEPLLYRVAAAFLKAFPNSQRPTLPVA